MLGLESIILYILLGLFVGVAAGLLGIGGGGIIVPTLVVIFTMQGMESENIMHMALGTSMATIVITSISSLKAHHKKNGVLWNVVKMMSPGIIIGTFLATFIASILSSLYLAIFFSIFMAYVSSQMIINKKPKPSRKLLNSKGQFFSGTIIGAISAMVSIGGGSLTVPYLIWQNVDVKKAIGTSAAVGFPIAVTGTIGFIINGWDNTDLTHYTLGYVSLPAFFFVSICSYFTAPIGVKLAHTLPSGIVKKIFALLLISLCLKMLFSFI
ncbi:sulfite exporter TauE/SafE family protein [Halarcobacter sp.]|uniref:sulfite exporter TauE/SafE family protein n=1 Tax=Halarcobacter sp. TaxID=2321133 RepID=UPI0029F53681|nr:sulfite exporter TauE/SafE family protein [Halarcobacter sp.]